MNYPIKNLSPVVTDATVLGLVVNKSTIKSFQSRDGSNREVFSFTLQDGTESIKCTCWGNMTIHSNCFGVNDIVQVEYPDIKSKSISKWATATTSDYELHLGDRNTSSNIRLVVQSRDQMDFLYRPINPLVSQIQSMESLEGQQVNLCAGLGKICSTQTIRRRNQEEVSRTNIKLFDKTGEILVSLWGEFDSVLPKLDEGKTVIYISELSLSRYKGRLQGSTGFTSSLIVDPALPYATELAQWIKSPAQNRKITEFFAKQPTVTSVQVQPQDITTRYEIAKLKDVFLSESAECYGYFVACMSQVDILNHMYEGCADCHKKLDSNTCSCGRQERAWFHMMEADFMDHSGTISHLRVFGDIVTSLVGKKATDLHAMPEKEALWVQESLRWKRCKVYFKMTLGRNGQANYRILDCTGPDRVEE